MNLYFPIALIVVSNIFYHISTKSTPADIDPFASVIVTYLVGAAFAAVLYFIFNKNGSLVEEYRHISWSSFVLGLAIVGLEAGSILMYKAGWDISAGQLVYSALLAICLLFVGAIFYHEAITVKKVIGVLVCLAGLYLIQK